MNREPIYAAMFAVCQQMKTDGKIVDCSRVLQHWEDLGPAQQPFVCMVQIPETGDYKLGASLPTKWRGGVRFVVYCSGAGDSAIVPATQLNEIIDDIESYFNVYDAGGVRRSDVVDGRRTLGGLVYDVRCFGQVITDDGTLGTQSVAIVPVEFLVG